MKTSISVIVPLYYGGKYVDKICENISYASLKCSEIADVELIFVNDQPAEKIVLDLSKYIISIKLLEHESNMGVHTAKITGLSEASGEWILFLDQDDSIDDNYFLSQLECAYAQNRDYVISNGYRQEGNGTLTPIYKSEWSQKKVFFLSYYFYYSDPVLSLGQVLIKRKSIPERFIERIIKKSGVDDFYFMLLLLESKTKGVINKEKLYIHSFTDSNLSKNYDAMYDSLIEMIGLLAGILNSSELKILKKRIDYQMKREDNLAWKIRFADMRLINILFGIYDKM